MCHELKRLGQNIEKTYIIYVLKYFPLWIHAFHFIASWQHDDAVKYGFANFSQMKNAISTVSHNVEFDISLR